MYLKDNVLGEVEKNIPGKGSYSGLMPSRLCVLPWEGVVRSFIYRVQREGMISSWNSSDWLVVMQVGVTPCLGLC